jgi:lipopolysaccharide/colanic/teichoic acid biosynthesis glycosyltransferase
VVPSSWLRARTSVIDRLVAAVLLVVLSPAIAVLARRVRAEDGGPGFVALDRSGRGGRTFAMWKLRSMRAEDPSGRATGAAITATGDDRITQVGASLRRWRLDELPQLWNVVRGDMGLLGPRPETPTLVDLADARWTAVLSIQPGITGPTQLVVERWESEVLEAGTQVDVYASAILPVKLAIDEWYVRSASPWIDLRVAWSMVERFALGREDTSLGRLVRRRVPEAAEVPTAGAGGDRG